MSKNQINIKKIESRIIELKRDFCEWIGKKNSKINENIKTNVDEYFTDSLIFSFNYTSTVEELYKLYTKKVYHIHGCIKDINFDDETSYEKNCFWSY